MSELTPRKAKWMATVIFLAVWLWFVWWIYQNVGTAYGFWQHGIEKRAVVGEVMMGAGLNSNELNCDRGCWYRLEIESEPRIAEIYHELEAGTEIRVLVMPGEDGDIVEGNSQMGLVSLVAKRAGWLKQLALYVRRCRAVLVL